MKSRPPAPSSPAIVSSSGRPAATSVPNASTSSVSVSGHDSASDFIIAALLAWLKSDHMAAGPVRRTVTPGVDSRARRSSSRPAASTISAGAAPASPMTIAVRRSRETVTPCWGASTPLTARSPRSTRWTRGERGAHRRDRRSRRARRPRPPTARTFPARGNATRSRGAPARTPRPELPSRRPRAPGPRTARALRGRARRRPRR